MIVGAVIMDLQSGTLMSPTALISDWHVWWSEYERTMFGEVASAFYKATFTMVGFTPVSHTHTHVHDNILQGSLTNNTTTYFN